MKKINKGNESEFVAMSSEELFGKERELREHLFKLRMQKTTGQLGDFSKVRAIKKDLARLMTAKTQKLKSNQKVEH